MHAEAENLDLSILDSFMDYIEPIEMNLENQDDANKKTAEETQYGGGGGGEAAATSTVGVISSNLYPDLSQLVEDAMEHLTALQNK